MEKELDNLLSRPASYYKNLIIKNNPKFDFKKPVILFGSAKLSLHFIKFFLDRKTRILALSDNDKNKIGKKILGLNIINKKDIQKKFGKDIQIVVTSVYYEEIIKELKKMGFYKVISPMFFFTIYHKYFNLLAWNNNINLIFKNRKKIKSVFLFLKDKKSRKIYLEIIKFRLTLRGHTFNEMKIEKNEYFDKVIKLSSKEIFLDGGAYDGDTIKTFIEKSKNIFSKIYSFEPDDKNYIQLKKYTDKLSDKRVNVYKIGLGKVKEKLHFTNEGNLGSRIISQGKKIIETVSIDSLKDIFTYIKLDIEGFEKQALIGARKTISKYKPKLAICVYHSVEDLWEVPYLINKINKNYKFYLRHYASFLFEIVCYAI